MSEPVSLLANSLGPWDVFRYQRETLHAGTRKAAMALADQVQGLGFIEIEHEVTGERWQRRAGQWSMTRAPAPAAPERA